MSNLTEKQAYMTMFVYLKDYYKRTKADDIGSLLGDLRILPHGGPADPAAQEDWHDAMEIVLSSDIAGGDKWE